MSERDREFLLVEYQRIGGEVVANESMGDSRANLYVTLWAAVVAGVAAFRAADAPSGDLRALLAAVLGGLALLGVVVLVRLVDRSLKTDELVDALTRLRELLVDSLVVTAALPWKKERVKERRKLLRAGLVQVLTLLNAAIAAMALIIAPKQTSAMSLCLALVIALLPQLTWLAWLYDQNHRKRTRADEEFRKASADKDLREASAEG